MGHPQGPVRFASFAALLFIVSLGFLTSYSAPATVDMLRPGSRFRFLTLDQRTWIASLPPLAGIFGNAASGYVSHRLGRKAVLLAIAPFYVLGWLAIAYAPTLSFVYAGRLATGFCAGICSVAIPAYLVEVATVEVRGFLASGFQVAFSLGVLLVLGLGALVRWSWLAVAGCSVVVGSACLMTLVPESPSWLARNGRVEEALQALRFLRGRDCPSELAEMMAEEPVGGVSCRVPIMIAVSLMFFQQFSGINGLMSYAVELFQDMRVSLDPFLASVVAGVVQLVGAFASSLLIDRVGRKTLFVVSGAGMGLSLLALGLDVVPLIAFACYIASYSVGFGPIPFVVIPELVPTRLRSLLLGVGSVSCSLFGFLVTKLFANMRTSFGLSGLYWTYCGFSVLGSAFYYGLVPETKGRTIRDIQLSHRSVRFKI